MKLWIKMKEAKKIWLCINMELFLATSFVFRSLLAVWAVFIAAILGKCSWVDASCYAIVSVTLKWTASLCWCGILLLTIGTRCTSGIGSWWVERRVLQEHLSPLTTTNCEQPIQPTQWVRESRFAMTYRNLWEIMNNGSHLETWAFEW